MRVSRWMAGAAGVVALTLTIAGCTSGGDSEEVTGDGTSFDYRIPDRFKNWLEDDLWNEPLQEAAGVDVGIVDGGPENSHYQQLDLMLSSGDLEDATVATMAQTQVYGPQGAFLDLAPLIAEHAPNLRKYIDDHPDFEKLVKNDDGTIYGLVNEYPKVSILSFFREDMMAGAGVSSAPTSVESFTSALAALKTQYGSDPSYYPLGGRDTFINYQYAFAANDGIDEEGSVHGVYESGRGLDIRAEGFRDMLGWYADLYADGLIDPEWVKGAISEEDWQTKMLTGKISVTNDFFTRPSYFLANADMSVFPDYSIGTMPALTNGGEQMMQAANERFNLNRVFVVNAKTQNSLAIMKFLDFLYSEEGQDIYHWGVEGESYDVVDGQKQYTVDYAENADQPVGTPVWNFMQDRLTYPAPVSDEAFYQWADDFTKSFSIDYFDKYLVTNPVLKYTTEQLEERSKILASVDPFVDAELVKFVTGQRSIDDFDAFVSEAADLGYDRITEIDQAASDAMN